MLSNVPLIKKIYEFETVVGKHAGHNLRIIIPVKESKQMYHLIGKCVKVWVVEYEDL